MDRPPVGAHGTTLNIVAHEDDDLLFLSPGLLHAIRSGRRVTTVFVTAGDIGQSAEYWRGREAGAEAAYARMCGVRNTWTAVGVEVDGRRIRAVGLSDHPSATLVFLRLPDGNLDGAGFASTGHQSLEKLLTDAIETIDAVDASSNYSKRALIRTLAGLMRTFRPDEINTHDYTGSYGGGDHSDHYSVAHLVRAAGEQYPAPHVLRAHEGYSVVKRPANVNGKDLAAKQNAFYAYAEHDPFVWPAPELLNRFWRAPVRARRIASTWRSAARCVVRTLGALLRLQGPSPCARTGYAAWLRRQYTQSADSLS